MPHGPCGQSGRTTSYRDSTALPVESPPWAIFEIDGIKWCRAPGTWLDNRENLPADYPKRLLAAAGKDKELCKAWLSGKWDILRGSMFADVLSDTRQMVDSRSISFKGDSTHTQF